MDDRSAGSLAAGPGLLWLTLDDVGVSLTDETPEGENEESSGRTERAEAPGRVELRARGRLVQPLELTVLLTGDSPRSETDESPASDLAPVDSEAQFRADNSCPGCPHRPSDHSAIGCKRCRCELRPAAERGR